ncbi:MAG: OmpH family outer membrane protein [Chitinophagaceae bacterium]|nr:MAG: OmpH family outer membrane protein [Chitinophagaceae bacterium]
MNKIRIFVVAFIMLLGATTASAQKIGYFSLDQMVGLMPETAGLETTLQKYQADSLNPRYAYIIGEYQRKDSMANGKDSGKLAAGVRLQMRQELEGLAYQIQNWQQYAQQEMQGKQNELLEPIYRKVITALNAVAKENNYAYVATKDAFLVAPQADDLLPLVAKKLNVKLPGAGAPAGGNAPAGGAKPAPKTGGKQ